MLLKLLLLLLLSLLYLSLDESMGEVHGHLCSPSSSIEVSAQQRDWMLEIVMKDEDEWENDFVKCQRWLQFTWSLTYCPTNSDQRKGGTEYQNERQWIVSCKSTKSHLKVYDGLCLI